jgi:hypothetical protein
MVVDATMQIRAVRRRSWSDSDGRLFERDLRCDLGGLRVRQPHSKQLRLSRSGRDQTREILRAGRIQISAVRRALDQDRVALGGGGVLLVVAEDVPRVHRAVCAEKEPRKGTISLNQRRLPKGKLIFNNFTHATDQ